MSPRGLLMSAAVIALLFGGAHALGLRAYTAILSGTAPPGSSGGEALILGVVYAILYFAAVVAAPILATAASILWAWEHSRSARRRAP